MKYMPVGILLIICGCASAPMQEDKRCTQNDDSHYIVERTRQENATMFPDGGQDEDVNLELGRKVEMLEKENERLRGGGTQYEMKKVTVLFFRCRPNHDEQLRITSIDNPGEPTAVFPLTHPGVQCEDENGFASMQHPILLKGGRYRVDNYGGNKHRYIVNTNMLVGDVNAIIMVVTPRGERYRVPGRHPCIVLMPRGCSTETIWR